MTITINPSPEIEAQLRQEAAEQNIPVEDYCVELLIKALPAPEFKNGAEQLNYWQKIGLVGMWADRNDIKESVEYAGQLRQRLQTRQRSK